jgi:hypothetical protein
MSVAVPASSSFADKQRIHCHEGFSVIRMAGVAVAMTFTFETSMP